MNVTDCQLDLQIRVGDLKKETFSLLLCCVEYFVGDPEAGLQTGRYSRRGRRRRVGGSRKRELGGSD